MMCKFVHVVAVTHTIHVHIVESSLCVRSIRLLYCTRTLYICTSTLPNIYTTLSSTNGKDTPTLSQRQLQFTSSIPTFLEFIFDLLRETANVGFLYSEFHTRFGRPVWLTVPVKREGGQRIVGAH